MSSDDKFQEKPGAAISLERRVEVYPSIPLPEFDSFSGPAFAARFRNEANAELMAIICTKGFPVRTDFISAMRTIDNPGILRLRENGIIHWNPDGADYYALAYDRPLASRYWNSLDEKHTPPNEETINSHFVKPMVSALAELRRTGIMHGGIRTTNIFWNENSTTAPQLFECLSAPPGMDQPVLFETIERAMAQPAGRGTGTHADDCYAFGVTLALVVLGHNPLHGLDDKQIINMKMEKGSFNALVGTRRIASSHAELLRGLLVDDAKQRWGALELEQWLAGKKLPASSLDVGKRAKRSIEFAGKEYWQLRQLAAAMTENITEATNIIENGALGKWISHSFEDETRAEKIARIKAGLSEGNKQPNHENLLITRAVMIMDPSAPIRYRGTAVMPGGIASYLAELILNSHDLQIVGEIITSQFAAFWVDLQKDAKTDLVPLAQQLDRARVVVEKSNFGNGLERALYQLNPSLPCLSSMLRQYYVDHPRKVLTALEAISKRNDRPAEPIDRHLAAFLIVHDKHNETLFEAMTPGEPATKRGLAILTLLGDMQNRYGPEQLPGLAAWIYPLVESLVKRFFNLSLREKIWRQAKTAVDQGDLAKLLSIVNDQSKIEKDEKDFVIARQMYSTIQAEISALELELSKGDEITLPAGRIVAAIISTIVAMTALAVVIGKALLQVIG